MNSGQRIVVTFYHFGQPVRDEGNELVQYLGTLVRMSDHVSIEYFDWRKVPKQKKEDMYSLVKSKFVIHPKETDEIKKWIFYGMGKKWRTWKGSLKTQEKMENEERSSRSKMKEPLVTGTKSFARITHEEAMNNNGVHPTQGELYIKTHTRKDGTIVDEEAAKVVASLKAIASDSTSTTGDLGDFSNDDYSKVKGPEKRGYVRLVERMPTAKSKGDSSTKSQKNDHLMNVVNVMLNIIQ
ncbi:uncharacterized protein LOC143627244 [Bidens hawaiensis]|uniref:uncharacterized protein LOC143627244 n=1 Tax=Bidens hawaiensis TaxID=980011 RepID=UPI00404B2678